MDNYFKTALNNKKKIIFFILFVIIISLSMMSLNNYYHPKMEIAVFILILILGTFSILYYLENKNDLHKVAFVIILCFGLIFAFITPMFTVPDEFEHFTRAEITSQGDFFPAYVHSNANLTSWDGHPQGYKTIQSTLDFTNHDGGTYFTTDLGNKALNYTPRIYHSAFTQNPFYGYLAQAFGILLTKILDLNAIWMLWLGRCFNLILYAGIVAVAVKKAPVLKTPMIVMACLPLAVIHSASMSIDALINGLGFLIFAYYLYMIESPDNSLDLKNIAKFSILTILLAFCKVPYLAFIFLLLFVPKEKFKTPYYYNILFFAAVTAISVLWSQYYAVPNYSNSFRNDFFMANNVSLAGQVTYMSHHLLEAFISIVTIPNHLGELINALFVYSYPPFAYSSGLLTVIQVLFLGAVIFAYPVKNTIKTRIGVLFTALVVFFGTYVIQLLTWTPVGDLSNILGVQVKYFIPLLAMLPFIFSLNNNEISDKINDTIIISVISILASVVMMTTIIFY